VFRIYKYYLKNSNILFYVNNRKIHRIGKKTHIKISLHA